jgi:hypothetical protein
MAEPGELARLPDEVAVELSALLERYFEVGTILAADRFEGTAAPARAIAASVDRMIAHEIPGRPHFWHEQDEVARVRGKALELADAKEIEDARLRFGDLSVALSELMGATGVPAALGHDVHELHCPMYRSGQGGSLWLQPAGDVRNPYSGSVMLECFDEERALPPSRAATGDEPASRETEHDARQHVEEGR